MNHNDNKPIFLTGATGFIGSHVAEQLSRQGYSLICSVRENSRTEFLRTLPVRLCSADLTDPHALASAMEGTSAVIHTAGKVSDWGSWQEFDQVNVDGTRNVLNACLLNGIRRIIITGSIACFGEESSKQIKDETSPHLPRYPYFLDSVWPSGMNYYRISKSVAVQESIDFAQKHHLDLTVIHPVWVYGEREFSSGFYEYMKMVKTGMSFAPGSHKNYFHVIYAGDLARSYQLAFEKAPEGINNYIIGNNPVCKQNDLLQMICNEMGCPKPRNLPKALAYTIGFLTEGVATLFRWEHPPFLTRARVNLFYDSARFSTRKAEEELSFQCDYSLDEGIKRTVQWYKENKLI